MAQRFSIKHTDHEGTVVYLFMSQQGNIECDDSPCLDLPNDPEKLEEELQLWRDLVSTGASLDSEMILDEAVVGVVE